MLTASTVALAQTAGANSGARLILFGATNFEGESRSFNADVPDLGARSVQAGDFAASAMAYGVWQVCMDAGYRTRCRQISGPVADLGADRQSISSIRLIRPPTAEELRAELPSAGSAPAATPSGAGRGTPVAVATAAAPPAPPRLVLYNLSGFRGGTREIDRTVANLGDRQWDAGDFAGSLVAIGEWEVCMDSNFRTRCRRVTGEVADLGRDAQSISSVRLIRPPTAAEAAAGAETLARIQAPPPVQSSSQTAPQPAPAPGAAPPQQQAGNPVTDAAGRIANDAARAAEQRASEEAQRRARQAVGSIFGGNRN